MGNKEKNTELLSNIENELENLADQKSIFTLFEQLKTKDHNIGQNILDSFSPVLKSIRDEALCAVPEVSSSKGTQNEQIRLQLDLYKAGDRLKTFADEIRTRLSPYISYSERMARREADLEKFARSSQNAFLTNLFDRIDEYFDEKENSILRKIDEKLTMKALAKDSFVTPFLKAAHSVKESIGKHIPEVKWKGDDSAVVISMKKEEAKDEESPEWAATTLESILREEIVNSLAQDLKEIINQEKTRFEEEWKKKITETSPHIDEISWFSAQARIPGSNLGIELHPSTQVFAASIATALTGTLALAAGWHTLEYAMAAIFPPAAIASILLGGLAFFITKDSEKEKAKEKLRKSIRMLYQNVVFRLYKEPLDNEGRTLTTILDETCTECVKTVMKTWEEQISGKMTLEDYRVLIDKLLSYAALAERVSATLKSNDLS